MQEVNSIVTKKETKSSLSPSLIFSDLQVKYPYVVTKALCELYEESSERFSDLIIRNREWPTDYQYCFSKDGTPINWIVQIDMCGLNDETINSLSKMSPLKVKEILRSRIFEVENSWAVYQILSKVCEKNGTHSYYTKQTKRMLDSIRKEFNMPIALLAVTEAKYEGMLATEFGKGIDETITKEEVYELSGFDNFFGPKEFKEYLDSNGACNYLLYVRASDPIDKLKKPGLIVEQPLLGDDLLRRIIKANSLTFNVDNPNWSLRDSRRINDTKWYMPDMNMAFPMVDVEDLKSEEFAYFLWSKGFALKDLLSDKLILRAKPAQGTYGCYGHLRGTLMDNKFRNELKNSLISRGPYMLQIEQEAPVVTHTKTKKDYAFIDRLFCGMIDGEASWMGGHREFLPYDSEEAKNGRLHGNKSAIYAEIL